MVRRRKSSCPEGQALRDKGQVVRAPLALWGRPLETPLEAPLEARGKPFEAHGKPSGTQGK